MLKTAAELILFLCLITGPDPANRPGTDPYAAALEIPVYPKGYDIQTSHNALSATASVIYHVQADDPPAQVLEFYDSYFNAKGWNPSFEACQRNWVELAGPAETGETGGKQLFASWEHPQCNLKAALWITCGMQNKTVGVKVQLQPQAGSETSRDLYNLLKPCNDDSERSDPSSI